MNNANNTGRVKAKKPAPPAKPVKPWTKMTTRELAEATKDLNRPIPLSETRPLNAEERAWWEQAKRGRPKVGRGAKPVLVTIERGLLERADAFAEAEGKTRSQLIAEGLRVVMGDGAAPYRGGGGGGASKARRAAG